MRCPWSSTVGRSAAMPAAPATASTNSPSAWPTGSSLFRPTPVEGVAWRSPRCVEPVLPVSVRTPLPLYSHQARKSTTQHLLSRPLHPPNDFTISQCLPSAANSRQISALPVVRPPACGIADRFHGGLDLLGVAQIVAVQGLQVVVELVYQRHARRNVQLDDVTLRDIIEVLHQRAHAVAVRGGQHRLALPDNGRDGLVPQRQEPRHLVLQALGER